MKTTKFLVLLAAGMILFTSCFKNDPQETIFDYVTIIVNEGNYSDHNGSLIYYNEESGDIKREPLRTKTGSAYSAGANYQSVALTASGLLFLLTNEPDKVILFNLLSGEVTNVEITDSLKTPRFMSSYGNSLLVSNWGAPKVIGEWGPGIPKYGYPNSYVALYNAKDGFAFEKKIPCGSDAEGLIVYNNYLFVATAEGVKVFDLSQSPVQELPSITSIMFTGNAKHFVVDASWNVWVSYTDGGVLCFDPATRAVLKEYPIKVDEFSGNITISKDGSKLITYATTYDANWNFTGAAVYATDIATGTQTELFSGMYNIYSIGVNPHTGSIYTADTRFDANSTMIILDETGKELKRIESGVGTSRYAFFAHEL